ncbi:glutamate receptor 2-like [Tubulanus polymorphus]|uniref:glutamate receptor 2-like n=1 Tax=Tubulanus polymorphus TaxID=672921 RepID=UPI003DA667E9
MILWFRVCKKRFIHNSVSLSMKMWLSVASIVLAIILVKPGSDAKRAADDFQADSPKRSVKITTILAEPFMMKRKDGAYEGYIADLIDRISKKANFNYEFQITANGRYGVIDSNTGLWNGMIGELINRKVDMAAADMTITSQRERIVDFSTPFLNTGIGILMKKPASARRSSFAVFQPFRAELWFAIVVAYVVMSIVLFLLARFGEWQQSLDGKEENRFSLAGSFWYLFGSPGNAGCNLVPNSISVRIISSTWWIFSFFVLGAYVAKLFPFLTPERLMTPSTSLTAEDLSKQTFIKYGTIYRGSTWEFFRNSRVEVYSRMYRFMESSRPSVYVNSTKEGIERVKRGYYAFLTEAHTITYHTRRDCSLMQAGGYLDSKGLGFAFPIGSPLRQNVSSAILMLAESGVLQMLYNRWFIEPARCETGQDSSDSSGFVIGAHGVHPLFGILLGGLGLAGIVAIFEMLCIARRKSKQNKVPFCDQVSSNMRQLVASCCSSTRIQQMAAFDNSDKLTEIS